MNLAEALASENEESFERFSQSDSTTLAKEDYLFRIQPAFFRVGLSYLSAALFTIFTTMVIAYLGGSVIWVLGITFACFLVPVYQHIKWNNISYILTSTKIEFEQGILEKNSHYLSLWHIQNVTVSESLLERFLGIGDVLIDSASTSDKMALKKIRHPRRYANLILAQLPRLK